MRTKTPEQISKQAMNLCALLRFKSWNGFEYADREANRRIRKVTSLCRLYIDRIYRHFGVLDRHDSGLDTEAMNQIWHAGATPVQHYV